jgi:hypothetical protein
VHLFGNVGLGGNPASSEPCGIGAWFLPTEVVLACLWMEQMQLCILPDLMRGLNSKTRCGEVSGVAWIYKGKFCGVLSNGSHDRALI